MNVLILLLPVIQAIAAAAIAAVLYKSSTAVIKRVRNVKRKKVQAEKAADAASATELRFNEEEAQQDGVLLGGSVAIAVVMFLLMAKFTPKIARADSLGRIGKEVLEAQQVRSEIAMELAKPDLEKAKGKLDEIEKKLQEITNVLHDIEK